MLSRERVRKAVRFEGPDCPPLLHGFAGGVIVRDADWVRDVYRRYPEDFGIEDAATLPYRDPAAYRLGSRRVNSWGVTKEVGIDHVQGITTGHPLADWDAFESYQPPAIERKTYDDLQVRIAASSHSKYVMMNVPALFDTMTDLRGFEQLMVDFSEDMGRVRALAEMVFDIIMKSARFLCETDVDCIGIGDDWGTQESLIVSPRLWRELFKPFYAAFIETVRAAGKDVWFHCCGQIMQIVPDLIEIGVGMLHPQIAIFPEEEFLSLVRGKLCIVTDIDRQTVMPHGTPDEVHAYSTRLFEKLYQPEGGMVMRAELGTDVPRENVEAFYRACADFRESVRT